MVRSNLIFVSEFKISLLYLDLKSKQRTTIRSEVQFEIPYIFPIELVWETVQQVLNDVVNEYTDYHNALDSGSPTTYFTSITTGYTNRPSLTDYFQWERPDSAQIGTNFVANFKGTSQQRQSE